MNSDLWQPTLKCRVCGYQHLATVFDFGLMPLADKLEDAPHTQRPAPAAPLELQYCPKCSLSQLSVSVSPKLLFDDSYPYYSSVSPALRTHFRSSANDIISNHDIGPEKLIVEAASNDGYMLRHFASAGSKVVGFEPASGPASVAQNAGIETRIEFFNRETARDLVRTMGQADVFLANNVLAHVPDLTGFVAAIADTLKPDGVAVIEVPYLVDLVLKSEFDTIYHQHLCYFSVTNLVQLFGNSGLHIDKAERISVHGGSLRLHVRHGRGGGSDVDRLLAAEQHNGWHQQEFVQQIAVAAERVKTELSALLADLDSAGHTVCGYGAAAKAATMLSWCNLDKRQLRFVADLNSHKHGKFMPGTDLEICSTDEIMKQRPDYVLILAWNFADEIMNQLSAYQQAGGRFIIPIPELRIV